MTGYWSDGVMRTPPIAYTRNTNARSEDQWKKTFKSGKLSKAKQEILDTKSQLLRDMDLEAWQLKYVDSKDSNNKSQYCRESEEIVKDFFDQYKDVIPVNCIVFRDSGDCFKGVCNQLVSDGRVEHFVEYTAAIHEKLSPNDNKAHGIAKAKWRAAHPREMGNLESTLFLLKECQVISEDVIKGFFEKNFMLDTLPRKVTQKECEDLLANTSGLPDSRQTYLEKARLMYEKFRRETPIRGLGVKVGPRFSIPTGLDGEHWN